MLIIYFQYINYYAVLKENIHKLTSASNIDQEQNEKKTKKIKLNNNPEQCLNDFTPTSDFDFHETTNLGNLIKIFVFFLMLLHKFLV